MKQREPNGKEDNIAKVGGCMSENNGSWSSGNWPHYWGVPTSFKEVSEVCLLHCHTSMNELSLRKK